MAKVRDARKGQLEADRLHLLDLPRAVQVGATRTHGTTPTTTCTMEVAGLLPRTTRVISAEA